MTTTRDAIPPDLEDEITSLNAIYDRETLVLSSEHNQDAILLTLNLPQTPVSLQLQIPATYPDGSPLIERVTHVDETLPKGYGTEILDLARGVLVTLTSEDLQVGQPILYEFIEALEARIAESTLHHEEIDPEPVQQPVVASSAQGFTFVPRWTLSEPLQSHKSTFLARACPVSSPQECHSAVQHLLATDKRAAKATHNMWAYRIRGSGAGDSVSIVYADADDDGEDGAGAKLAALLLNVGAWGVLVVVSRWYGGIKLGPERWRLIGSVGRDAVIKGGEESRWIVERS